MNTVDNIWDELINLGVATQKELELITCINGYSIETLESVIYARTGYRNLEGLLEII